MDKNEYNIGIIIKKEKQIEEKDEKIKNNNYNKEEKNDIELNKDKNNNNNKKDLIDNNKDFKENENKNIKDNNNNKEDLQANQNCKDSNDTKISLFFESVDQKIKETIVCQSNESFHILEGILYEKYPQYKESENYFIVNGVKVNRFKTLKENNIKNGDKVVLNIIDYDD